jgi:hypothetical protein
VSLGINMVGVIPVPPTMAAARMSLRPMLFMIRQEGKQILGDALIEIIAGHLNADIVASLDDFVDQAEGKLKEALAAAGSKVEEILTEICKGLDALVDGKLGSKDDLDDAGKKASAAAEQLLRKRGRIYFPALIEFPGNASSGRGRVS